jgi:hypothetical protein
MLFQNFRLINSHFLGEHGLWTMKVIYRGILTTMNSFYKTEYRMC